MLRRITALIFHTVAYIGALLGGAESAHAIDPPGRAAVEKTIRLGVVSYGDPALEQLYSREPWLLEVTNQLKQSGRVELAQGTYGEIESWIENGRIDLAAVTPGVAASIVQSGKDNLIRYLASERTPRRSRSICVVPASSKIHALGDLKDNKNVQFIFVNRLSVSGRILPQYLFNKIGLEIDPQKILYSSSHVNSLRTLEKNHPGVERIACVWEDILISEPDSAAKFRVLPVPEIENFDLPGNILIEVNDPGRRPVTIAASESVLFDPGWRAKVDSTALWLSAIEPLSASDSSARMNLEDFGLLLLNHLKSRSYPPRLAVVLSGGGAKCSYQVGALRAIEEQLALLRTEFNDPSLDIGLVVGTSGGAINAVAAAIGATSTKEGFEAFSGLWQQLAQRKIIRPSRTVRINMALWFFACQNLALLIITGFFSGTRRFFRRGAAQILISIGAMQLFFGYLPIQPAVLFGDNGDAHRFFLWACWGMQGAGFLQIAIGIAALLFRGITGRPPELHRKLAAAVLLLLVVVLPIVQTVTILWREQTLSENIGIKELVAESYPKLIDVLLNSENRKPIGPPTGADLDQKIRSLSAAVTNSAVVKRDLVLAASRLPQAGSALPADLYFYLPGGSTGRAPNFHDRGIALSRYPNLLFDAMIGSGAIYPVFPERLLVDFPEPGQSIEIVDGSFSHRSPIEAAVLWGATHIIVLEASPEEFVPRGSFASNIGAALAHLYDQAQLLDLYSKEHVTTVTLFPRPPHIGLLDFSANFISRSIETGYHEARSDSGYGRQPFKEQQGEPVFVPVP